MHARNILKTALAGAVVLIVSATSAMATQAEAKVALNVRTGPGSGYSVIDTLYKGERVNTTECRSNGWCYIEHSGPDGWVASRYLTTPGSVGTGADCGFRLTIGAGGAPSLEIVCDGGGHDASPPYHDDSDGSSERRACFFTGGNYSGSSFCQRPGTINMMHEPFNDSISSVRLYGGASVRLCEHPSLTGHCEVLRENTPYLDSRIEDRASSAEIGRIARPEPPRDEKRACFYTGSNYRGASLCRDAGTINMMHEPFNDSISSVRLYGGASVRLCEHPSLTGHCEVLRENTPYLDSRIEDRASSAEIGRIARPEPPRDEKRACFYTGPEYAGRSFCMDHGRLPMLVDRFNDDIASVRIMRGTTVKICEHPNLTGRCQVLHSSTPRLEPYLDNHASSLEVTRSNVNAQPIPGPTIYRQGSFSIDPSFTYDLDDAIKGGPGSDLWYRSVSPSLRRLEVRNGARMAVSENPRPGYYGCAGMRLKSDPIRIRREDVGTTICMKTSKGRFATLRITALNNRTLKVSYKIWNRSEP